MDCSPPGFSVHGVFQARILEWVAISFSGGSSPPRDRTQVLRIAGRRFTLWATREALSLLYCPINIQRLYIFSHKKNFLNFTSHSRNLSYYSLFPSRKAPFKSAYSHNHHCLFSLFFSPIELYVIPAPFTLPYLFLSRLPVTTGNQINH